MAVDSSNLNKTYNQRTMEYGKFVPIDASEIPALAGFNEDDGVTKKFALLVYNVGGDSGGGGSASPAYQTTPINGQVTALSASAVQITNVTEGGWLTISIDPAETATAVYVGGSGVTSSNGFKLSTSNPSTTVSLNNLSSWYVRGTNGTEKVYFIGAHD